MQSSSQRCDWPHQFGYFIKEPIDVVLAITSSNDPLNPNAHKVGPAIAAGCACILKPAMQTPFSAMALAECLFEAGVPAQCSQIVNGNGTVGEKLVRDKRVAMVSFAGVAKTGELITRAAGIVPWWRVPTVHNGTDRLC